MVPTMRSRTLSGLGAVRRGLFNVHEGSAGRLDGLVESPIEERILIEGATLWDEPLGQRLGSLVVDRGRISQFLDPGESVDRTDGLTVIDATGGFVMPGLIDTHVHMLFDSDASLLKNAQSLIRDWFDETDRGTRYTQKVVERGQLKLKSGVTTMRILGDGYYSVSYRDDLAAWSVVGPRVLTAAVHVNTRGGYISGGVAAGLSEEDQEFVAVNLDSYEEIELKLTALISQGIDVVKISTTHGDLGFGDAAPDLPERWVKKIVDVAHEAGLKVTAHSYGNEGNWAAVRGGVDGIEHLVNVPHSLDDDLVKEISDRGIYVCPTLAGSSYSVTRVLNDPDHLVRDLDIVSNVTARVRRDILITTGVLQMPGFVRFALHEPSAFRKWEVWRQMSLENTASLHEAGVSLIFGTDTPFTIGNFWHSVSNEANALAEAGVANSDILAMATSHASKALGISHDVGTLTEGKSADILVLEKNPLKDLANLDSVTTVIKQGRVVYQKTP